MSTKKHSQDNKKQPQTTQPLQDKIEQHKMQNRWKWSPVDFIKKYKMYCIAAGIVVILLSSIAGVLLFMNNSSEEGKSTEEIVPFQLGDVEIVAQQKDSIGIEPATKFTITTEYDVSAQDVASSIQIQPATSEFTVNQVSEKEYELAVNQALEHNTVYRFQVATLSEENQERKDMSWAFQTKNDFQVVRTLPGDKATEVPRNTGIEITFTHDNFTEDYTKYFEISPNVEGSFEKHKRTLVFVPKSLSEKTLYTVTIKKGLPLNGTDETLQEDKVIRFETAGKDGEDDKGAHLEAQHQLYESPTREVPVISLLGYDVPTKQVSVEVYATDSRDKFIEAMRKRDEIPGWADSRAYFTQSTEGMKQTATFQAPLQKLNTGSTYYFRFPDTLPSGSYLVDMKTDSLHLQTFLQVTNIASYMSVTGKNTVFWVHNTQDTKPVNEATITLSDNSLSQKTDQRGYVMFATPANWRDKEIGSRYYIVEAGDDSAIVPFYAEGGGDDLEGIFSFQDGYRNSDNFWTYLYSDRPVYHPTDKIQYWGIVRARDDQAEQRPIEVRLLRHSRMSFEDVLVATQTVTPQEKGAFSGTIPLQNAHSGFYRLDVYIGDEIATTEHIVVEEFTKPAYKIEMNTDKKAVFAGEKVVFSGKVSFFEGSPVPGMKLTYEGRTRGEVVTDTNGLFSFSYVPSKKSNSRFHRVHEMTIRPKFEGEADVSASAGVSVFYSAVELQVHQETLEEGKGKVEVQAHQVDPSKLDQSTATDQGYRTGYAKNINISGTLQEHTIIKTETGQYYDFVYKETRKTYEYKTRTKTLRTLTGTTNQEGVASFDFPVEKDKYYSVDFSAEDENNRESNAYSYIYGTYYGYSNYGIDLEVEGEHNNAYSLGEKITMQFKDGDTVLQSGEGDSFMFVHFQRGILTTAIQQEPTYELEFKEEHVPNVYVQGIYFNGRTYIDTYKHQLKYNHEEKSLNVTVGSDKETYEPGSEVNLNVQTHNAAGEGVKSHFALNLVDEALYLVRGEELRTRSLLYTAVNSGELSAYLSHQYPEGFYEPGGAGGEGGRDTFMDTAFFYAGETGEDGTAQVTFTLPDNLTSWRVNAQAVSHDKLPLAGHSTRRLRVIQPFFVQMNASSEYLQEDKPVISVTGYGDGIDQTEEVDFTISAKSLGIEDKKLRAKAFQPATFTLDKLQPGQHSITISAQSGTMSDTITQTILVRESRTSQRNATYFPWSEKDMINMEKKSGNVTVIFSNHKTGTYYTALNQLLWNHGDRADHKIARAKSLALQSRFNSSYNSSENVNAEIYQHDTGGISLLPYSDPELELSAMLADVASEKFDSALLEQYFTEIINSGTNRERIVIALYGLAALQKPVLVPTQQLLEEDDLTVIETLYLALALAKLGDQQGALSLLQQVMESHGESSSRYSLVKTGEDQDDILKATAMAAYVGVETGHEEHFKLFGYTIENRTEELVLALEKTGYLLQVLEDFTPGRVKFTYTHGDSTETISLEHAETYSLDLPGSSLDSLEVSTETGEVGITLLTSEPLSQASDSSLSLSREYEVSGVKKTAFSRTDLVKITLQYNVPAQAVDGCYQVTDVLPSGLEAVTNLYRRNIQDKDVTYPYEVDGQRVKFCVYKRGNANPVVYYARVTGEGTFTAEQASISPLQNPQRIQVTREQEVLIK